ncbi:glycosyltransferase family 4 protein [Halomarina salina]|uniref:Glycosyltransferase family 4 protein n=1 Tax=Halomarina salina TaxID=1872699 RepID=A0ABD5RIK5_9EURY|nr:glycosyltransferase [Halomarina salina]
MTRSATAGSVDDEFTVGVYHPAAGVRSSGGVVVFVQESVPELAALRPTTLVTRDGDPARALATSDADLVTVPRETSRSRAGAATVDLSERVASWSVAESVAFFLDAWGDGTLERVEEEVDVLLTHDAIDTLLLTNRLDVPVVRVYHSFDGAGAGGNLVGRLSRPAATVANSRVNARTLASELGVEVDGVAYPGVDVETFSPSVAPAFERDEVVVLFVGLLTEAKGVFDLVRAFASLSTAAELVLVGRGNEERVAEAARALGIEDSVTFAGEVSHADLPGYYRAADVLCLPTHNETFGMVNLEAMACGTPVVTSDLPGVRQYATDGESALLVPPGDVERLAARLDTVVSSPELRRELGQAGRAVAESFTWRATAERLLAACADVASAHETAVQ